MNRLIVLAVLFFSTSCLIAQTAAMGNARLMMIENETIHLKLGETCSITLDERNKGQYAWTFSFSQNQVLYKKSETVREEKRSFVFAPSNSGEVTVTMTLMNRQTGAVAKTAPKTYKIKVLNERAEINMAAVSAKPAVVNKPKPVQPKETPVYASTPTTDLLAKSDEPTTQGFYVPANPNATTSNTISQPRALRGTNKVEATASAAPSSAQPTTSAAVSSFHTDVPSMSVFGKNIVRENEVFGIDIEENIPTGKWIYVVDKSAIQLVDEEVFEKGHGLASKNKVHAYKFKANQAGVYDILFHVFSAENHTIDKYITYTIEVK